MVKVAVADAAPIIAFARVGQLGILPQVLGEVIVPETVARECLVRGLPGANVIAEALTAGLLIRHADIERDGPTFPQLDAGETAAIRLSLDIVAALLIDERLGRGIARRLGITVIGSLGVLIAGKQRGLIPSVGALIDQMRRNGYYIAEPLAREAILKAGEDPR